MKTWTHYCFNCGQEIGVFRVQQRQSDFDTCGASDCNREARDTLAAIREEAHEELDRMNGWD